MSMETADTTAPDSPHIVVPAPPPGRRRIWAFLVVLVGASVAFATHWAWSQGKLTSKLWKNTALNLETVTIDRGDMDIVVVESGSLESANNTTVKCKVEALIG